MTDAPRSWTVLLIGGASGSGKTRVSYRVAQHFGIGITEVDDFQVILEKMTTPELQPTLHYWQTHLQHQTVSAEQIFEHTLAVARVLHPALEAVIANHLEGNVPIVLEGDFILPALAVQPIYDDQLNNGRVRSVFIDEPDESQLLANYAQREPDQGAQQMRARVSWLHNQWLRSEAARLGVPVLPSRPWDTLFHRLIESLTS
ncbi:MAG: hypothetical protein U0528_18735 [Anaerolineae bacterium]